MELEPEVAKEAGKIVMHYEESEWLDIDPFGTDEASQDAKGAFSIMCHILSTPSYGIEKHNLLAPDGTQVLDENGHGIRVSVISKPMLYQVILTVTGIDVTSYRGANALEQGLYRISLPSHSMNDKETGKNTFAKGGIYFARSHSLGWKFGYIFARPGYERSGFYKKNNPEPTELKRICERMVGRLNGELKKKIKVKVTTKTEENPF